MPDNPKKKMIKAFKKRAQKRAQAAAEHREKADTAREEAHAYQALAEGLEEASLSEAALQALYEEVK